MGNKELFIAALECPVLRVQEYVSVGMILQIMRLLDASLASTLDTNLARAPYFTAILEKAGTVTPDKDSMMWWCTEAAKPHSRCRWYMRVATVPPTVRYAPERLWMCAGKPVAMGPPPIQIYNLLRVDDFEKKVPPLLFLPKYFASLPGSQKLPISD